MTLTQWYKIHALCTVPFAIPMVVAPSWTLELLQRTGVDELAIDLCRLLGAAYILITLLTVAAAFRMGREAQVVLAQVFCLYESLGVAVGFTISSANGGALGRWLAVGFFAVFAAGYGWFGFIQPRTQALAAGR